MQYNFKILEQQIIMQKSSDLTEEDWISIGNRIKMRRKELHIKQGELAKRIDVSSTHMSAIERGFQHPGINTLLRLSEELDVTPDYFLLGNMHSHNLPLNIIERLMLCDEQTVSLAIKIIQLLDDDLA